MGHPGERGCACDRCDGATNARGRVLAVTASDNYASPLVGLMPFDNSTLEAIPDGVLVADGNGRVEALNAAGARILRSPAADALGRDWREVLPRADPQGRDWWACTR